MNQYSFQRRPNLLAIVWLVTVLPFAGREALSAPLNSGSHVTAESAMRASRSAPSRHAHALPSRFANGFVYIKVSVNGHPDAWMILDTGSTNSIIDTDYAKSTHLKLTANAEGQATFGTTKAATFDTEPVNLRVGNAIEKGAFFQSIAMRGMQGPDGVPAAGMLGHSFLKGKSIVIDYPRKEVYFEDAQHTDPRDVAMTIRSDVGVPTIKLKIADQLVDSLIDTGGSYGIIITPTTAKQLGIEKYVTDAKPADTVGHGGDQHIVVGKAPPFSVGDLVVNDLRAAYTTFGTATETIGAGVSVGTEFLQRYKVTLNYVKNTARFEP